MTSECRMDGELQLWALCSASGRAIKRKDNFLLGTDCSTIWAKGF
ncbi:hypothetical protein PC116_g2959 [Phytophthora cactorum]|nr:hypothetical protein Pcac1_g16738 [Phytophthora cactorum]KAG2775987.1 hypothetical protein Pcac1_g13385 [Phytophthora cactorum]KAG4249327.1 hypothetical protein PC116_g2959 [Phytophthora cactorum]